MTLRRTLAFLVLSLVACGGSDDSSSTGSADFSGTYRPADPGPIGSITFADGKSYMLMPSGCPDRSCAEVGTYRLEGSSLYLTNAEGRTKAIAIEILKTTASSGTSLVKSLRPQGDLVDPGEQLTQGSGQQLANGDQQLAQAGQQLLQMIQQAMMNGQNMNKDNADNGNANNDDQKKNDCQVGFPRPGTPQDQVDAYWARCPNGP